jgi:fructose-bisphosphate aldolase class II/tagatose 1,6-diphosphate aldolase GatY/KbaY
MKIQERLKQCQADKTAILATNFYNLETLQAILAAASASQSDVILQLTQSSIDYMGLKMAVAMAKAGLDEYQVNGWLHLDHGNSVEIVKRCLDVNFDSVMIDASEKSFAENVAITSQVVELAKSFGANVEAELGYVPKLGQTHDKSGFTTAEEAQRFVRETGVDALAIAIGSAHGFYKSEPKLDMERLSEIHDATAIVLVLHGSSGIPNSMVCEAITHGISKVNLATEIKDTFMRNLKQSLLITDEIDLRKTFPIATKSVTKLLCEKFDSIH